MFTRIELQPAYVLHSRPYRDTSLLIDFFTPEYGRIGAVARGVRQRKARTRSLLNPFTRVLISLQGKTDLKLMTAVEADNHFVSLQGAQLYSGFYINELLMRVLPETDAHQDLFGAYEASLNALEQGRDLEPVLRCFELTLLSELGYGIDFQHDAESGAAIQPQLEYSFNAHHGFTQTQKFMAVNAAVISGTEILAMAQRDFSQVRTRLIAKQLCRQMLKPLLGVQPLNSRDFFVAPRT